MADKVAERETLFGMAAENASGTIAAASVAKVVIYWGEQWRSMSEDR